MANQLYYPSLNPIPLYEVSNFQQPQYMSTYSDDYPFKSRLRWEQTVVDYNQKWTTKDTIKFQFLSNFDPIQVQLMDCQDNAIITNNAAQKKANKYLTGYFVYEESMSLAAVSPGVYYILVTLGGATKLYSEPIEITDFLADSLLFEYYNSYYHGDILFETGIVFSFRVEGILNEDAPSVMRTAYLDQHYNPTVLKAIPFRTSTMLVGKDFGVPQWIAYRINWIFSCDNVSIDGKPWAVPENEKMTGNDLDPQYPMKSFSLKIQEAINRASKIVGVDVDPNKKIVIGVALDSTIFGDLSGTGNNIIHINTVG